MPRALFSSSYFSNDLLYPSAKPQFLLSVMMRTCGKSLHSISKDSSVEPLSATTTSALSEFATTDGRYFRIMPAPFQLSITIAIFFIVSYSFIFSTTNADLS